MQAGVLIERRTVIAGLAALLACPLRASGATPAGVDYWHHFTSQSEFDGLKRVLALFAARFPAIAVTQEAIPNPEFMPKLMAAIMADSRPDVAMVTVERIPDILAAGGLLDLSARIAEWPLRANFPPDRWAGVTRPAGIYGVPAFAFVDWLYYRKDWFDEAGLAPPETLADLAAAARRLTDPARGRYGFGLRGGPGGAKYVVDVLAAFGCPIERDGVIGLDRPAAIEALGFYAGLLTRDKAAPPSAADDGYRQVMEAFRTGRTAMVWHHTGSLREISAALAPGVQVATACVPAGPVERVARLSYACHGMMTDRQADASWDWISFWGETEPALAFLDATGFFPASTALLQDARIAGNPLYGAATRTLAFGRRPPSFPGYAGWADTVVLPAFQKMLIGQWRADEAVDDMEAGLERILR